MNTNEEKGLNLLVSFIMTKAIEYRLRNNLSKHAMEYNVYNVKIPVSYNKLECDKYRTRTNDIINIANFAGYELYITSKDKNINDTLLEIKEKSNKPNVSKFLLQLSFILRNSKMSYRKIAEITKINIEIINKLGSSKIFNFVFEHIYLCIYRLGYAIDIYDKDGKMLQLDNNFKSLWPRPIKQYNFNSKPASTRSRSRDENIEKDAYKFLNAFFGYCIEQRLLKKIPITVISNVHLHISAYEKFEISDIRNPELKTLNKISDFFNFKFSIRPKNKEGYENIKLLNETMSSNDAVLDALSCIIRPLYESKTFPKINISNATLKRIVYKYTGEYTLNTILKILNAINWELYCFTPDGKELPANDLWPRSIGETKRFFPVERNKFYMDKWKENKKKVRDNIDVNTKVSYTESDANIKQAPSVCVKSDELNDSLPTVESNIIPNEQLVDIAKNSYKLNSDEPLNIEFPRVSYDSKDKVLKICNIKERSFITELKQNENGKLKLVLDITI